MIPRECKRLAEVDFPLARVSRYSVEGGGRSATTSALHLWWARRPLAACRAMMLALLLPDPRDPSCPVQFKQTARGRLPSILGRTDSSDTALCDALLDFIGTFSNPNCASSDVYIETSRELVKAAYSDFPLVVDTFAGGGSIPFEALRVGCDVFASDWNPVAALLLRVLLGDAARCGSAIAHDVRREAARIQQEIDEGLREYYWRNASDAEPIAYLWARTVQCETPNCGAEVPVYRSPWLAKRGSSKAKYFNESSDGPCAVILIESAPHGGPIEFRVARGSGSETEQPGYVLMTGTKVKGNSAGVVCPCCKTTLPGTRANPRVQTQLTAQKGGADVLFDRTGRRIGGARLLAVVERVKGKTGVRYRLPCKEDYHGAYRAGVALEKLERENKRSPSLVPDEAISLDEIRRISVPLYGITAWGDLFTTRQKLALAVYARAVQKIADENTSRCAALALDRLVMLSSAHCRWKASGEALIDMFGRHAIGMVWDFAEAAVVTDTNSIFSRSMNSIADAVASIDILGLKPAQVERLDACETGLPNEAGELWFVDPPYYDSIPYAHLSDVFYVWLKRAIGDKERNLFCSPLTDKSRECVVDRPHRLSTSVKTPAYYEAKVAAACAEGRRITSNAGIGCVVFAHKTTEGWEALLQGVLGGGWCVTASWPIATELPSRLNARETASLASSVHLVCRPRTEELTGDWGDVLRELPQRVGDWMNRLEAEGIRGADLVFACIGPALEIFSRYARVETPDGTEKTLAEYLEKVWEVVGRVALEQVLGSPEAQARNGGAGALEEDARLTALFLWTLQSTDDQTEDSAGDDEEEASGEEDEEATPGKKKPGFTLIYDVARRFAQPLGIHLSEWEGRIIETKKGVVRLLPVRERSQQLFGEPGAELAADRIERVARGAEQLDLFSAAGLVDAAVPEIAPKRGRRKAGAADDALKTRREATTLDRVHAAMLLQAGGRANALRSLLKSETERTPDFLRLANALSALYPKESEEKRLLDAMLLAAPR